MEPNLKYGELADDAAIEKVEAALKANGIKAFVAASGEEARKKVLEIVPEGAEVMTMSSQTLEALGLVKEFNESGRFQSVKKKLTSMDQKTQGAEMRQLGSAPEWAVGSVHAATEDGHLMIASNTGSQLPAYAYGAAHVMWVIGAQKIVKDVHQGMQRIQEYSFPLEDVRAQKAYGMHSGVNKILLVNKEVAPGRLTAILVKEKLGF